jgi:hypothetical protein
LYQRITVSTHKSFERIASHLITSTSYFVQLEDQKKAPVSKETYFTLQGSNSNSHFLLNINMLQKIMHKLLLDASLLLLLLLILVPRNSDSLQFPNSDSSRRTFFVKAATAACFCCTGGVEVANAAIDVSGLKVEQSSSTITTTTPGRAPNQPSSGPLAGTSLGFQVGGGPRPEDEVRKIDEPRYAAVRKSQGKGPLFLDGVPIEQQITTIR